MRNRLTVVLILTAGLVFSLLFARQLVLGRGLPRAAFTDRTVRVLTTPALVAARGPAEAIFKAFETAHDVKIEVVVGRDPQMLVERLAAGPKFDLVLGIDPLARGRAAREVAWRPVAVDTSRWAEAPRRATDDRLVAFDWSPLAFIHRGDGPAPRKFAELTDPRFAKSFVISDARATAPGYLFAGWAALVGGDGWLGRFAPNVAATPPTWTAAYGLFERKRARFVWTYLTSLAFHWGVARDRGFGAVILPEGHPAHVELAGVPAACVECELGDALLHELLTPDAQRAIMAKNFMMPVDPALTAGTVYAELPSPKLVYPAEPVDPAPWTRAFGR